MSAPKLALPLRVEFDFHSQRTSIVGADGLEPTFEDVVEVCNIQEQLVKALENIASGARYSMYDTSDCFKGLSEVRDIARAALNLVRP